MKLTSKLGFLGLTLAFGLMIANVGLASDEKAKSKEKTKTIRGEVTALETNEQGAATSVAIVVKENDPARETDPAVRKTDPAVKETTTDDKTQRYEVISNDQSKELLKHVGKQVEVMGNIKQDTDGNYTIEVTEFNLVDESKMESKSTMDKSEKYPEETPQQNQPPRNPPQE